MPKKDVIYNSKGQEICGAKNKRGGICKTSVGLGDNGRCRMHGGTRTGGPLHHRFKHGRYSKFLPDNIREKYEEAISDEKLNQLWDDIAIVDARLKQLFEKLSTRESSDWIKELRDTAYQYEASKKNHDVESMVAHADELSKLARRGAAEWSTWRDIQGTINQRAALVRMENDRIVQLEQTMTAEQAMVLVYTLSNAIKEHVRDPETIRKIMEVFARFMRRRDHQEQHEGDGPGLGELDSVAGEVSAPLLPSPAKPDAHGIVIDLGGHEESEGDEG